MNLVIRADAGTKIGLGHVMRCLALAQGWLELGGEARFLMAEPNPLFEARLAEEAIEVSYLSTDVAGAADTEQLAALARERDAAWVVVDGYQFDAAYQRRLREFGLRLLWIDDYGHASDYCADLILNQNVFANEGLYPRRQPETKLLLGTRFALLRREFWRWQQWTRAVPWRARRLLLTFGGGDTADMTAKSLEAVALLNRPDLEILAVGGGDPAPIASTLLALGSANRWLENELDMADPMAKADAALTAAGSTTLEALFMGLPSLVVVMARNQVPNARLLEEKGTVESLGWHSELTPSRIAERLAALLDDPSRRGQMASAGRSLNDGRGVFRVLRALTSSD